MRATINFKRRDSRRIIVLVLLLVLLLIPSVAGAGGGGPSIYWNVIAAGGGRVQAAGRSVEYTIGQPFVGVYGGAPAEVQAGFWNSLTEWWANYMPIINRGAP